ncbi:uncharacterized protein MONBRDRAFT_37509 [Monosiga brevicollis MX1]|uniref:DUF1279 domain-containing protein n=1 Tax=Monosiga brevicollis TaxID=81824 RepID=A9V259_MONBE|nr:uncharacterized protein MONBRDRAFT_37509 [Monosiga brevicollis MX1]EDQ88197.1 predicted protein [Monosiga brevicollis MX1]|eukprot:XP_001746790.1 hypothetical protein [Monosiga brevicollis MX1]
MAARIATLRPMVGSILSETAHTCRLVPTQRAWAGFAPALHHASLRTMTLWHEPHRLTRFAATSPAASWVRHLTPAASLSAPQTTFSGHASATDNKGTPTNTRAAGSSAGANGNDDAANSSTSASSKRAVPKDREPLAGTAPAGGTENHEKPRTMTELFRKYGKVAAGVYFIMGTIDISIYYVAIQAGVDVEPLLHTVFSMAGLNYQEYLTPNMGALVGAYTIHKLVTPVRLALTASITPRTARYLADRYPSIFG